MIRQLVHDPTLLSGPFSWIGPLKVSPLSLYIYIYIYTYIYMYVFLSELGQQRSSTRQKVFHWIVSMEPISYGRTLQIFPVSPRYSLKNHYWSDLVLFFFFFCKIEDLVVLWFLILLFYEQTVKECRIWEAQGTPLAN